MDEIVNGRRRRGKPVHAILKVQFVCCTGVVQVSEQTPVHSQIAAEKKDREKQWHLDKILRIIKALLCKQEQLDREYRTSIVKYAGTA